MSIHVALNHVTHYRYDRRVGLSPQIVRLRPAPHCRTHILSYSLKVEPEGHFINWQQDAFANYLARLVFPEKTTEFKVTVDVVAEMSVYNPFDFFLEPGAQDFPFAYDPEVALELQPYLVTEAPTPAFAAFLASIDRKPLRTIDFLVGLNQRLQNDIRYLIRMEPGVQSPEQTLTLASGSCRDSGWLLVQTLRHLGLAARFVSGYLIQLKPDVKALDGPSGTEVDFTDLHAWCEVFLPGAGWIGLDPTSGLLAGEGHIPLAATPDPSGAAPITGYTDECEVEFDFGMSVTRIHEDPRVTKPYTDEQWAGIDARLDAADRSRRRRWFRHKWRGHCGRQRGPTAPGARRVPGPPQPPSVGAWRPGCAPRQGKSAAHGAFPWWHHDPMRRAWILSLPVLLLFACAAPTPTCRPAPRSWSSRRCPPA